ncbi:hypothetical protein [Thalassospira tepidiphila]|uniref:hypothetical protein n=1 Tax=Thalassospira tepidiphila TaxID=393657 RepID=UPI001BCAEE10|nr:hypothetical protein [Thalassospira tepidiphila]
MNTNQHNALIVDTLDNDQLEAALRGATSKYVAPSPGKMLLLTLKNGWLAKISLNPAQRTQLLHFTRIGPT